VPSPPAPDNTKAQLFIADGGFLADQGDAQQLGGDHWGMVNSSGSFPGQFWLTGFSFWYQVDPFQEFEQRRRSGLRRAWDPDAGRHIPAMDTGPALGAPAAPPPPPDLVAVSTGSKRNDAAPAWERLLVSDCLARVVAVWR